MNLGMYILAAFLPTLNEMLGLVNLFQFSLVDWTQCRINRYLFFLLHFLNVDIVFFLVASMIVKLTLVND